MKIEKSEWEWFGFVGHFICGRWCRFHLTTKVGPWWVSTVGMYVHPRNSGGGERSEYKYLKANPDGEEVGCGRFYETMVFRAGPPCDAENCNCGMPVPLDWQDIDGAGYNSAGDAQRGHIAMCEKWSTKEDC